jgi:hypothetical protein
VSAEATHRDLFAEVLGSRRGAARPEDATAPVPTAPAPETELVAALRVAREAMSHWQAATSVFADRCTALRANPAGPVQAVADDLYEEWRQQYDQLTEAEESMDAVLAEVYSLQRQMEQVPCDPTDWERLERDRQDARERIAAEQRYGPLGVRVSAVLDRARQVTEDQAARMREERRLHSPEYLDRDPRGAHPKLVGGRATPQEHVWLIHALDDADAAARAALVATPNEVKRLGHEVGYVVLAAMWADHLGTTRARRMRDPWGKVVEGRTR